MPVDGITDRWMSSPPPGAKISGGLKLTLSFFPMLFSGMMLLMICLQNIQYGLTNHRNTHKQFILVLTAYSGTSGQQNRKHPDTIPATSGQ